MVQLSLAQVNYSWRYCAHLPTGSRKCGIGNQSLPVRPIRRDGMCLSVHDRQLASPTHGPSALVPALRRCAPATQSREATDLVLAEVPTNGL